MISRIVFFFTEAVRSVFTSLTTSIAAMFTMLVALVIFGLFSFVLIKVNVAAAQVEQDASRVKVFLNDTVADEEVNTIREKLLADPDIQAVEYLSKEDALEKAKEIIDPAIIEDLKTNPFPASLEADIADSNRYGEINESVASLPGVLEVGDENSQQKEALSSAKLVQWTVFALAAILLIASTLIVSTTIKLSIFARRREIEVMKLVGASNWFVRIPFMIEGFIFGLFAAVASIGLLIGIINIGYNIAADYFPTVGSPSGEDLLPISLGVLAVGVILGVGSSSITMRKFLRV